MSSAIKTEKCVAQIVCFC